MINLTTQPVLITNGLSPEQLNRAIRAAIRYAIKDEAEHYGATPANPPLTHKNKPTFARFFLPELAGNHLYGSDFIQDAFVIANGENPRKMDKEQDLSKIIYTQYVKGTRHNLVPIKSGLKTVFLYLWSQGVLLLPLNFETGTAIRETAYQELLTEVARMFWSMEGTSLPGQHDELGTWSREGFRRYGHRIIFATDWHAVEQADIHELSRLHVLTLDGNPARIKAFPNATLPFTNMLKEMVSRYALRLGFTAGDVLLYSNWAKGDWYQKHTLKEYIEEYGEIRAEQKKRFAQNNNTAARKRAYKRRRRSQLEIDLIDEAEIDFSRPAIHSLLEKIAAGEGYDAAVEYFKALRGTRGKYSDLEFPGRAHVDLTDLTKAWLPTFDGFLQYRDRIGAESSENHEASLGLLRDYLFCHLPWWKELHPDSKVGLPLTPAEFLRFTYWVSDGEVDIAQQPMPFMDLLLLRRNKRSVARVVTDLFQYFEYLEGHAELYPELDGVEIKNPIKPFLDRPKVLGKRQSGTNKVPFRRNIMPFILRFFYAVEEFGLHLQHLALQGQTLWNKSNTPLSLRPADFGYTLSFDFRGETYVIDEVPNIFPMNERVIRDEKGHETPVLIPHLSTLRILIVGLETGLRIQAVQWLCRQSWDKHNRGKPDGLYVYELLVNTDKVRAKPWIAPIVYRARNVLLREQTFQESIAEAGMDTYIPYEGRKNSRFDALVPLFRTSGHKGKPVDDSTYNQAWREMLIYFQVFYNDKVLRPKTADWSYAGDYVEFVEIGPYWASGIESEKHERVDMPDDPESPTDAFYPGRMAFCPVNYAAIHTPHAVRSTFISNRSGILEVEDTMQVVGHLNKYSTYHYTVPDFEALARKVEESDRQLWDFDPDDPAHLKAESVNAALRDSLERDGVDATITRYGLTTVSLVNGDNNSDQIQDGIELLRTTKMTELEFQPTHICPTNGMCPSNIMDVILEPRRCGLCPIAVKGIDHLKPITRRMRKLLEQVVNATQVLEKLWERLDEGKITEAEMYEIQDRQKRDCLEYFGWARALTLLNEKLEQVKNGAGASYQVDDPITVRQHLQLVVKQSDPVTFVLERIEDCLVQPSLNSPEFEKKLSQMRQTLLTKVGKLREALIQVEQGDEIEALLASMRAVSEAYGLSVQDMRELGLFERPTLTGDEFAALPALADFKAMLGEHSSNAASATQLINRMASAKEA